MATCLGITTEKIRSRINISGVDVRTPYVRAWSLDKTRGRLATTFSATVEIPAASSFVPGADLEIYASVNGVEEKKFTGSIHTIQIQPSFDKAGYYILSISGSDRMGDLEGETFSRRLRSDGFSLFVSIDSGPANRPSRGFSIDKKVRSGKHTYTSPSPRPNRGEHTDLVKMPKRGNPKQGEAGKVGGVGPNDKAAGITGLGVHDHSEMDKGGPAFGVYSAD